MRAQWEGPWICCGDFNEVLCHDEHQGLRDRADSQIENFQQCMADSGLLDLGYYGPKFTWSNRQGPDQHVKACLDRAVANSGFTDLFQDVWVENVITTSSDHYAVLIKLQGSVAGGAPQPVQYSFKFEAMWLRAANYRPFFERTWEDGRTGAMLLQSTWSNLNRVAASLKTWSHESFGSIQ